MSEPAAASRRGPITVSVMLATSMVALDQTIANVALPHIQGSVSASLEQIGWVLTSYLVAMAIMTPLTGWLSGRFSRKYLFLALILGFTVCSMLCGVATSLPQLVAFRFLQGLFGAPLLPLSQAVLFDTYPPEKHSQAMAIWGGGSMLAPILGPVLGGWLTEHLSWRWVFFINLPIGIIAALGVWLFIEDRRSGLSKPFDFLGYGSLILFMGGLQMMLDRGPSLDWFSSLEIRIEAALAAISLWVFVAHFMTTARPFFDRKLARDLNFMSGALYAFFLGFLMVTALALMPTLMQQVLGYPVLTAGFLSVPRGLGTLLAMIIVARMGRLDPRISMLIGSMFYGLSVWQFMGFDLTMNQHQFGFATFVQGLGMGLMLVPATAMAFASVQPNLRAEGTALFSMVRNLGGSLGVAIMQAQLVANTGIMHSSLAGHIDPSDPVVRADLGDKLLTTTGLVAVDAEVTRQALMVAYLNDFRLMIAAVIICFLLVFMMRRHKNSAGEAAHATVE